MAYDTGRRDRKRSRSRSRSPYRSRSPVSKHRHERGDRQHRSRDESRVDKDDSHHHHRHRRRHRHQHHEQDGYDNRKRIEKESAISKDLTSYIPVDAVPARPVMLPFQARLLSKHDLRPFRAMFASYLDIQKGLAIEDLVEDEVKGRWKSFVKRWNRGELAAGWYDPETLTKAVANSKMLEKEMQQHQQQQEECDEQEGEQEEDVTNIDARNMSTSISHHAHRTSDMSSDDEVGPAPPPASKNSLSRLGPSIPTRTDLALRDDTLAADRDDRIAGLRAERKADRRQQRERLDEIAPRAEAGTRERQIEKRREVANSNQAFRDARGAGDGVAEVAESELMGGGEDTSVEGVKALKARMERKKNEREIRRDEILRARAEEREERMAGLREREDRTMELLRGLAKERFG